jgi:hypothetical protein
VTVSSPLEALLVPEEVTPVTELGGVGVTEARKNVSGRPLSSEEGTT